MKFFFRDVSSGYEAKNVINFLPQFKIISKKVPEINSTQKKKIFFLKDFFEKILNWGRK